MVRGTKIQKGLVKRKNSFYRYLLKQNKVLALVEMTKKYFLRIPIRSISLFTTKRMTIGNEVNLSAILTFQEKQMNDRYFL
jgi:hypothetical protein